MKRRSRYSFPKNRLLAAGVDSCPISICVDIGPDFRELGRFLWDEREKGRGCTRIDLSGVSQFKGCYLQGWAASRRYPFLFFVPEGRISFCHYMHTDDTPNMIFEPSSKFLWSSREGEAGSSIYAAMATASNYLSCWSDGRARIIKWFPQRLDLCVDIEVKKPLSLRVFQESLVIKRQRSTVEYFGSLDEKDLGVETVYFPGKKRRQLMRCYDKQEQIRVNPEAGHILDHWPEDVKGSVFRLEAQTRNDVLKRSYGLKAGEDVVACIPDLWYNYLERFSMRERVGTSKNKERWPVSDSWVSLQGAFGENGPLPRVKRVSKPQDEERLKRLVHRAVVEYGALRDVKDPVESVFGMAKEYASENPTVEDRREFQYEVDERRVDLCRRDITLERRAREADALAQLNEEVPF